MDVTNEDIKREKELAEVKEKLWGKFIKGQQTLQVIEDYGVPAELWEYVYELLNCDHTIRIHEDNKELPCRVAHAFAIVLDGMKGI